MTELSIELEAKRYLNEVSQDLEEVERLTLTLADSYVFPHSVKKLNRLVHSIKGTAGSYGFELLSIICHKMEDKLCSTDFIQMAVDDRVDSLLKLKDSLQSACTAYLEKDETKISNIKEELGIYNSNIRNVSLGANSTYEVAQKSKTKRILIAETSKMLSNKIARSLANFDAEISKASDGYEALGRLLKEQFDVVITSSQIPTIDAIVVFDVLEKVANPNKNIHRILITSDKKNIALLRTKTVSVLEKGANLDEDLVKCLTGLISLRQDAVVPNLAESMKLLVVDDSSDIHKLIDVSFRNFSQVKIVHCENPVDVETMAIELKPELILLDVQMPLMSGEEVFVALKKNLATKSIPIAFLTGSDSPEELARLKSLGPLKIFKKPFSLKGLAGEVVSSYTKRTAKAS